MTTYNPREHMVGTQPATSVYMGQDITSEIGGLPSGIGGTFGESLAHDNQEIRFVDLSAWPRMTGE